MFKSLRAIVLLFFAVSLFGQQLFAQDQCADILKHDIWEEVENTGSSSSDQSFMNLFCSKDFKDEASAKSFGGTATIPLDLPVTVGLNSDKKDWARYYSEACRREQGRFVHAEKFRQYSKKASEVIASSWKDCMSRNGLQAVIKTTADSRTFQVEMRYRQVATTVSKAMFDLDVTSGTRRLACMGDVSGTSPFRKQSLSSGTVFSAVCTRPSACDAVVVNISGANVPPTASLLELKACPVAPPSKDCADSKNGYCVRCKWSLVAKDKASDFQPTCPKMTPGAKIRASVDGSFVVDHGRPDGKNCVVTFNLYGVDGSKIQRAWPTPFQPCSGKLDMTTDYLTPKKDVAPTIRLWAEKCTYDSDPKDKDGQPGVLPGACQFSGTVTIETDGSQ